MRRQRPFTFFIFLLVLFQVAVADEGVSPYFDRTIEAIEMGEMTAWRRTITMTLSDGTVWKTFPTVGEESAFEDWNEGDRVYLWRNSRAKFGKYCLWMTHVKTGVLGGWVLVGNKEALPHVIEIKRGGRSLLLSDGSSWDINLYSSWWSYYWKVGDLVVVQQYNRGSRWHYLMNLSRFPSEDGTYVSGWLE